MCSDLKTYIQAISKMDENTSFAMSCISPPDRDYEILRYLHATILLIGCVLSVLGNTLNLLVHRN